MATEKETAQAVRVLVAAYPNAKIIPPSNGAPGTIEVYCTMLSDLPAAELLAAVKYCIGNHPDFMPTVATIRDAARKIHAGGQTVSGADAWGKVLAAIRDVGVYRRPEFDDPAIAQAVAAIGWRNICLSEEQDFATRAHFIKAYEAYSRREDEQAELMRIPEARQVMAQLAAKKSAPALEGAK